MMLMAPKKMATAIVNKMKGSGSADFVQKFGEPSQKESLSLESEVESDSSMAIEDAARRMLSAQKADDAKEYASALKDFIYLCREDEGGESEVSGEA